MYEFIFTQVKGQLDCSTSLCILFLVTAVDVITVGYLRLLSNHLPKRAFCLPSQTINARHMVDHKRILKSSLFLSRYLPYIQTYQVARNLAGKSGNCNPDDIFGRYQVEEVCYKIHWLPTFALGSYSLLTP